MFSEINTIIKIETEKSNRLFYKFFLSVNLFLILINSLFLFRVPLVSELYNQHIAFHVFVLVLFLIPIRMLFKIVDKPNFFKYVLLVMYIIYILTTIFINNFDVFYILLLFSINVAAMFYMSNVLYFTSAITITFFTAVFTYYFGVESNIGFIMLYRSSIILLISMGEYFAFTRLLKLLNNILNNTENPFIDALTGVYNKHYLKEKIANISYGGEVQLSIIALNIDDFKEINSKYGYGAGDLILQGFANIVQKILRNSDSICRNEGDDFVIIVQHPKEFEAENLADRIRKSLENEKFNVMDINNNEVEVGITASFGVVSLEEGESSDELLQRADVALKMAKEKGKNRIERI